MSRIVELCEEARALAATELDWDNDTDARTRARYGILLLSEAILEMLRLHGEPTDEFHRLQALLKGSR